MTTRYQIVIAAVLIWLSAACFQRAEANVMAFEEYVASAKPVGKGRLTYLFWDVYDATLYAPEGNWVVDGSFALELAYLRDLEGRKIAERTIDEMRKQGFEDEVTLARWFEQLVAIFPDVNENTSITGIQTLDQHTVFLVNGDRVGEIKEPEFSQRFFAIWLGEKTSEPKLKRKLLGES